jgi:hypothetical protein
MFSLKTAQPFPRAGKVEIASPDDSLHTALSLTDPNPSLILESPDTLLGTLQPLKAFGPSAFGPVHIRAVAPDGTTGEWLPLVTLVRLPTFTSLSCPVAPAPPPAPRPKSSRVSAVLTAAAAAPAADSDASPVTPEAAAAKPQAAASAPEPAASAAPGAATAQTPAPDASAAAAALPSCTLSGSSLYFVDSIATDEAFTNPTRVPEGFVGSSLEVPPPTGAAYYLRLRDDPSTVTTVILPAGPL